MFTLYQRNNTQLALIPKGKEAGISSRGSVESMTTQGQTKPTSWQDVFGIIRRDPETALVSSDDNSDTWPDHPDLDRGATPPRTTADSPCAVRAQSVRSHAVTSSPYCDSAHMDAYAHGFPI